MEGSVSTAYCDPLEDSRSVNSGQLTANSQQLSTVCCSYGAATMAMEPAEDVEVTWESNVPVVVVSKV
jgi:4-hydroxy-3-methylbut-2-enyl diphosphate reductase IspH